MWRTGKRASVPATGTEGMSQAGKMVVMVAASKRLKRFVGGERESFGVGLTRRSGRGERGQCVACGLDAVKRRKRGGVDVNPACVRELRHEAHIGHRRRAAV